jgi:hypothetical protein
MKDYAAYWFRARRKLGIDDGMHYGVVEPGRDIIHSWRMPHEQRDGVGACLYFLRQSGVASWSTQPARKRAVPGFWESWRRHRRSEPAPEPVWKKGAPVVPVEALPIAIHAFDEQQTSALQACAKQRKTSLNVLVFEAVHRMVTEQLLASGGGAWFVPVTLRGSLVLPSDEMNHASGFYLPLAADADYRDIQRGLINAMRTGEHWWLWHQARLVAMAGQWLVNLVFRMLHGRSHYLGSFSNIGEWQVDWRGSQFADDALLWGCSPGSSSHPLGACMMICNGRLVLSFKCHPVLGVTAVRRQQCMDRWCALLREQLVQQDQQHGPRKQQGGVSGHG